MALTLFGAPELSRDGVSLHLKRRKSVALIAYLALCERPQTRDRLASLFWPDSDSAHALASLRIALHGITSSTDWLAIDGDSVSFRRERCEVDVLDFMHAADQATKLAGELPKSGFAVGEPDSAVAIRAMEAAVGLYTDEFLRGFSLPDSAEFDDWQFFTAEGLQTQLGTLLRHLVRVLTPIDSTAAIRHAERLVIHESLNEDHHRTLIDLYITEGRLSAAVRQFEKCRELLSRELGEAPSSDLVELYDSIKGMAIPAPEATSRGSGYLRRAVAVLSEVGDTFTSASAPLRKTLGQVSYLAFAIAVMVVGAGIGVWEARRPPKIPTILVVPFSYFYHGENSTNSRAPVAAALTRFIENELVSESGLNVRAAGLAASAEPETGELLAIARSEEADFVLHGTVLDDGAVYTITFRLLDRWSQLTLLGRNFPATDSDLAIELTVLTDMATESIYRQIGPEMTQYLKSGESLLNPYCETATLLLNYHMSRTLNDGERAQLYSTIKENLPVDAYLREGYFVQADWYWAASVYGVMPPRGAKDLLQTALDSVTAEEQSTEQRVARGIMELIYNGDIRKAAEHFAAAYRALPTSVATARWWALSLAITGRMLDAVEVLDAVERFNPTDPSLAYYQSSFRYLAGDYEAAITAAERSIARNDRWIGLLQKGQALLMLGRLDEAVASLEAAVADQDTMQAPKAYLALAYAQTGRVRDARALRADMRFLPNDDPSHNRSRALEAIASVGLNQLPRAREELREAIGGFDPAVWLLIHDPQLRPVSDTLAQMIPVDTITLSDGP